jgi:hypothetical protein
MDGRIAPIMTTERTNFQIRLNMATSSYKIKVRLTKTYLVSHGKVLHGVRGSTTYFLLFVRNWENERFTRLFELGAIEGDLLFWLRRSVGGERPAGR